MPAIMILALGAIFIVCAVQIWRHIRDNTSSLVKRLILLGGIAISTYVGGTKFIPDARERIGNFIYFTTSGRLIDPSGIVAEHAEFTAVAAFEAETAEIIATVSGAVATVACDADTLHSYAATRDLDLYYFAVDAPRDIPGIATNHNISITQERLQVCEGLMSVWFRFSHELGDAPTISATFKFGDTPLIFMPITNTFPIAEEISASACYRYDYDISSLCATNSPVVIPPYEAQFGGYSAGSYLSTPATIEIVDSHGTTNIGFTGWVPVPHMAGLLLRAEGGAVIEAATHGTNYTGTILEEITL